MRNRALQAKIDWNFSLSLITTIYGVGTCGDVGASRSVPEDGIQRRMKNTSCPVHRSFTLRDYDPQ